MSLIVRRSSTRGRSGCFNGGEWVDLTGEEMITSINPWTGERLVPMIFIDGISSREDIRTAVVGIDGPVAINMIDGGGTPAHLTFTELNEIGSRASQPTAGPAGRGHGQA